MRIRPAGSGDRQRIGELIADFRVALAAFRGRCRDRDREAARSELDAYEPPRFRIFVAESEDAELVGYLVCKVEEGVVWAESLFVIPRLRRRGVGAMLYGEAERLAREAGSSTVYNWVHPNNEAVIRLLGRRGYDVLNLVELRRRRSEETPMMKMRVGEHEFEY